MRKDLQGLAWSLLPKEFKEEVKTAYKRLTSTKYLEDSFSRGMKAQLETLFGHHNLTSDAEGEEMLMVEKSKVQYRMQYAKDFVVDNPDYYNGYAQAIYDLFGPRCLPDDAKDDAKDTKPSNVDTLVDNVDSLLQKTTDLNADRSTCTDVCSSKIDGRRLRIAAQMIKAIMGSPEIVERISSADPDSLLSGILHDAMYITDALIAECMTTDN